jgi:hypothetical protein
MNKKFLIAIAIVMALPVTAYETMSKSKDALGVVGEPYNIYGTDQHKNRVRVHRYNVRRTGIVFNDFAPLNAVKGDAIAFDEYLQRFPLYAANRSHINKAGEPTGDKLIKLVTAAAALFGQRTPTAMQPYWSALMFKPTDEFLANLYDIMMASAKLSKKGSEKKYGMYCVHSRTKRDYYFADEPKPFFTRHVKKGWSWTSLLVGGAVVGTAAYLAYRNSKAIGNKASEVYANSPWLQNANEYVQPYIKKAGEGLSNAYHGTKNRAINLWDKMRGRTWADRYGEHARQKEAQEKVVRDAQRLNKDLLREQKIEYTNALNKEKALLESQAKKLYKRY